MASLGIPAAIGTPNRRPKHRSRTARRAKPPQHTRPYVAARRRGTLPLYYRAMLLASRGRSEAGINTAHWFTCFLPASLRNPIRTFFRAIQPDVFTHWNAVLTPVCPPNTAFQRSGWIGAFLTVRRRKKQFRSINVLHSSRPLNAKPLGFPLAVPRLYAC